LCLTFIVFFLANLTPNLEKLAKSQANNGMSDAEVELWLDRNGYSRNLLLRYGEWLGVVRGWTLEDAGGRIMGRCVRTNMPREAVPAYCGVLQGNFGYS